MHATSLQSVLDNFEVLLGVWKEAQCGQADGEMRARIVGVNAQMQTFDFCLVFLWMIFYTTQLT